MESSGAERKGRIFCPPTVSEALWSLVPADGRERLLLHVARQLRAGFHPERTVKNFLVEEGLWQPPVPPPAAKPVVVLRRPVNAPMTATARPTAPRSAPRPAAGGGFRVAAAPADDTDNDDDFDFDDEVDVDGSEPYSHAPVRMGKPLHPFGLRVAPATNDTPKGEIGVALHNLLGFPGEPGKKAADAEASVLRAIASDPAYAMMEPEQIGNLGCVVPVQFLSSITLLIVAEAERVQNDILARKENGDPTAAAWSNPDDWVDSD